MIQTQIQWEQAVKIDQKQTQISRERKAEIIEEIKTSSFELFDARDIQYFASELGITPNEVREIHLKANPEVNAFDLISTFENSEGDEIFDFF
jgi:hypothetical protein